MRASSSRGGRILTRAAASSIASGRPSSRRQISTTASAFFGVSAKSGLPAAARWTNSAIDAHCISVDGREERLGSRAAAAAARGTPARRRCAARGGWSPSTLSAGQASSSSCTRAAASDTCSKLSISRSVRPRLRRCSAIAFTSGRSPLSRTPSDRATADATSRRIGDRREVDERHAAVEVMDEILCHLDGQARLSGAARSGQRQQPDAGVEQHVLDAGELGGPADSAVRCDGRLWSRRCDAGADGSGSASPGSDRPAASRVSSASTSAAVGRAAGGFSSIRSSSRSSAAGMSGTHLQRARHGLRRDGVQRAERRVRLERMSARRQLVEDDAEREHVAGARRASRRAPAPATCSAACRGSGWGWWRRRVLSRQPAGGARRARPKSSTFT